TTERLRTDGTSFEPEIQELKGQPDRIKGYTGRLTVSFRTTPEQLPLLLAGCLDNGATSLGQFGSSPRETEIEAARREMVAEATQAALAQARTIADTVGQKIAGVELVQVNPAPGAVPDLPSMPYMAERAAKMAAPVPPVASQAGDSGLSVTVVMTLRVAPPS
ncbi:MAG: SIMPL domain-containing protein, partial [Janthinobacterium lividum]